MFNSVVGFKIVCLSAVQYFMGNLKFEIRHLSYNSIGTDINVQFQQHCPQLNHKGANVLFYCNNHVLICLLKYLGQVV